MPSSDNETTATTSVPATPEASPAKKSVRKPAAIASAKTAPARKKVKSVKPVKPAAVEPVKEKKPKLVRDSFTMPKLEFVVIDTLKLRAAKLAVPVKKTELIRAGIKALTAMSDDDFIAAIRAVPNLKTGRPAKT